MECFFENIWADFDLGLLMRLRFSLSGSYQLAVIESSHSLKSMTWNFGLNQLSNLFSIEQIFFGQILKVSSGLKGDLKSHLLTLYQSYRVSE